MITFKKKEKYKIFSQKSSSISQRTEIKKCTFFSVEISNSPCELSQCLFTCAQWQAPSFFNFQNVKVTIQFVVDFFICVTKMNPHCFGKHKSKCIIFLIY